MIIDKVIKFLIDKVVNLPFLLLASKYRMLRLIGLVIFVPYTLAMPFAGLILFLPVCLFYVVERAWRGPW